MGLDMYLEKRTYVGNKHREPKEQVKLVVPKNEEKRVGGIKTERIQEITEQVAYWRKANFTQVTPPELHSPEDVEIDVVLSEGSTKTFVPKQ